ncbi:MAG: substrate-binding domain-containing protein [Acetobacteraceae bacterium]
MQRRDLLVGGAAAAATGLVGVSSSPATAAGSDVVIGLSNGYFGTEWRDQMVAGAKLQFDEYKKNGMAKGLVVQQSGANINQQIQDIRNMIRQGVSVITVDANSATSLNGVINEAKRAKIPVVSFDQQVTNPYAVNVTVNHYQWGKRYAEWVAHAIGGKGKVVMLDGIPGHPAAEARRKAAFDTFKKFPGIKIVWSGYGMWDDAKAQAVMATVIAAQPEIDGAFVEDSMGLGVLRAFQNAHRKIPAMTGEAQKAFLLAWKKELEAGTDMKAFAQANPPWISRTALGFAVRMAHGKQPKKLANHVYYYPIHRTVTRDNLDQVLGEMKDKPDAWFLEEWLSEKQLDALFT